MKMQTRNLTLAYKGATVLDGVDLELYSGEILGIIGPNGAGKSTLLRCLDRIVKPLAGRVYLDDKPLSGYKKLELARRVGYVPQNDNQMIASLVWEVILLGRKPHMSFRVTERDKDVVMDVLELLDLSWAVNRNFNELSGGERQKVLLARALAQETDVLLLDEPTSSLDVRFQLEVMDIVHKLSREKNISVVVAIHDLNLAARYCDRLVLLHQNRIAATGPPQEVLTLDRLAEVYGIEAQVECGLDGCLVVQPIKPIDTKVFSNQLSAISCQLKC